MRLVAPALVVAVSLLLALPSPAQDAKSLRATADAAAQKHSWAEAADAYQKLVEVAPDDGEAWHMLGYALHSEGRLDEALKAHLKATEFPAVAAMATYNVACVHALKGHPDEAFTWLDKAIEKGFRRATFLEGDSDLDSLHDDPRWAKLLERVRSMPAASAGKVQVFAGATERTSRRLALFDRQGSPGQLVIDYGMPPWKDEYEQTLARDVVGRRWRLGKDFWTTLDSNVDVQIAGVAVPAGQYYLVLSAPAKDTFHLVLLDAAKIRAQKLDGFQAESTTGGIEVPLRHQTTEDVARQLDIDLHPDAESVTKAELRIRFGPHALTAPLKLAID